MRIIGINQLIYIIFIFSLNTQASSGFWDTPNAVTGHVDSNIKIHFGSVSKQPLFNSQLPLNIWDAFQLAEDCRQKIAVQFLTEKEKILELMHVENIPDHMKNTLKDEIQTLRLYNNSVGYSQNALLKLSLLSSRILPWATTIKYFADKYPDKLFNNYTFEDSLFIVFLQPKYPMLLKYFSRYKNNINDYTKWLASAMKKTLEVMKGTDISYSNSKYKRSALENILYQISETLFTSE